MIRAEIYPWTNKFFVGIHGWFNDHAPEDPVEFEVRAYSEYGLAFAVVDHHPTFEECVALFREFLKTQAGSKFF